MRATSAKLEKIRTRVQAGWLIGEAEIGVWIGKALDSHKVGKHFDLDIGSHSFDFSINEQRVVAETTLDGICVIRTSLSEEQLDAPGVVQTYKRLSAVERAFRSLKTVDLHIRPIRHSNAGRVRAQILLCMLSYCVQYHMQETWRSLLFFDEDAWTRDREDVVGPARRSEGAREKAATRKTADGRPVHSFRTLVAELGGIVRNRCRRKGADPEEPVIAMHTTPTQLQQKALNVLDAISTKTRTRPRPELQALANQ